MHSFIFLLFLNDFLKKKNTSLFLSFYIFGFFFLLFTKSSKLESFFIIFLFILVHLINSRNNFIQINTYSILACSSGTAQERLPGRPLKRNYIPEETLSSCIVINTGNRVVTYCSSDIVFAHDTVAKTTRKLIGTFLALL